MYFKLFEPKSRRKRSGDSRRRFIQRFLRSSRPRRAAPHEPGRQNGLFGQQLAVHLHVFVRRRLPAEVALHVALRQRVPFVAGVVVKADRAVDRAEEIIGVVALEGKAASLAGLAVVGRNGVTQAAGGGDDRHRAVAHGDQLRQAARLGL